MGSWTIHAGPVVLWIDFIGNFIQQPGQGNVVHAQRGSEQYLLSIWRQHGGNGNAYAQQAAAIHLLFIEEAPQLRRQKRIVAVLLQRMGMVHILEASLVALQICQNEPQPVHGDRYAHRQPRIRDHGQLLGRATARGTLCAGIVDQTGLQQFRQILIDGRQTQIQVVGDLLLGAG